MDTPYQYSPLNAKIREIRVLELKAGSLEDPIIGLVVNISLDAETHYDALSYVWGPTTLGRKITLSGHIFPVTDNLFTALQFARQVREDYMVWVDAICINQKSTEERSSQVALMGSIYSQAVSVLCWLGTPTSQGVVTRTGNNFGVEGLINEKFAMDPAVVLEFFRLRECDSISEDDSMRKAFDMFQPRFPGRSDDAVASTLAAFSFLFHISKKSDRSHMDSMKIFGADAATSLSLPPSANQEFLDGIFNALEKIIAHEWWSRVWTIQEVALARRAIIVQCHACIDFGVVARAAHLMYEHFHFCCRDMVSTLPKRRLEILERFALQARSIGLIQTCDKQSILGERAPEAVFSTFRNRLATDPRDKVNALLGLAKWTEVEPMMPTYSLPLEELYTNAMFNLIQQGTGLASLRANSPHHLHPELPSWVEDWSIPASKGRGFERLGDYPLYQAGDEKPLRAELCNKRELVLEGLSVDIVTAVGDPCTFSDDLKFFDTLRGWERIFHERYGELSTDNYANGQSLSVAFGDVLGGDIIGTLRKVTRCFGQLPREYNRSRSRGTGRSYHHSNHWWSLVKNNVIPKPDIPHPSSGMEIDQTRDDYKGPRFTVGHYMQSAVVGSSDPDASSMYHINKVVRPTTEHTRFFMTSNGYMGLGSLAVELGDLIYVPYSCEVPLVLRSCDSKNSSLDRCKHTEKNTFVSVGTCYIHGIMDGEAVKGGEGEKMEVHIL